MKYMLSNQKGFTLLEILLVVAAIAILAGVVIVAVNPGKQLADTRNATRQTDVKTISDAVYQYSFDHGGVFPSGIDTNLRMLGTSGSGCGVSCGNTATSSPVTTPQTITDNSASTFNSGSYSSTVFDTTYNWVQLTSGGSAGTHTSGVKNGGSDGATWDSLSWTPQFPTNKGLPNNSGSENGYPGGNVNMSGNVLLMHLNEVAGATTAIDSSGSNTNGTCSGATCPTLGASGRFQTGAIFSGTRTPTTIKNYFSFGNILNDPTLKQTLTVESWFKVGQLGGASFTNDQAFISKEQFSVDNNMFLLGVRYDGHTWFEVFNDANNSNGLLGPVLTVDGKWHHLAGTWNNGIQTLYLDGISVATITRAFTKLNDSTAGVMMGAADGGVNYLFNGYLDETAVYNRALSANEILDHYRRGATRLKLQVRSCPDSACTGQNFIGPDGTVNTFFTELSNNTLSTPSFSLSNVGSNRYFQYKTTFETDNVTYSPELKSVSVGGTTVSQPVDSGSSGPTLDTCLDLTTQLVSDYLNAIPVDSKLGTANNTYYAIKKTAGGRIMVQACAAENGKSIIATK